MSTPQDLTATNSAIANANIAAVDDFLCALRDKDLDIAADLLDDDIVYENVGFSRIRGARRVMKVFAAMNHPALGFDVRIHRSATDGDTVMNERTDLLRFGPVQLTFWVCGVFEVHDGKITLWRDYFDMLDMTKALLRGLVGAVIPALRPRL
ncbi:limonene-1,2-epoxide hydrolase [Mycolicibacterium insubricum]|jgi:limonene-1,2-epoxide hydrolase|uniref:Limonene-1,2-epoxide hydrolase n=1 Tax=Mycolicibacterium insubricum TaxID=444597 RepID=A0A1X0DJI0_9MYCO|nr:limonene-1,2-epoxide hydrolase family protein [Mycolicibacterium insubricum]MCB9439811.1 nuclear transport factor 2 family protein [Mycolicibacterium sp.]MCV7082741.1 nuclear transport factor 2 family protein [Mycolicibacterium insubricum]ORA72563.1 limonene-1,2-epoxide hydrolase [Mycolicibacterium insubricum]BBZ66776.1 limonene-1,2-epoxide hydrolase [Mycolicibacterium insubricum]